MPLLRRLINYIMSDKDRLTLIVAYLKKYPEKPHMLNAILAEHNIVMNSVTRNAIWEMIEDGVILWFPDGSIQYNTNWKDAYR